MPCEYAPPYWGASPGEINLTHSKQQARRLLKGIPGIPQGSRLFFETVASHLIALGFRSFSADKCLFGLPSSKEKIAIVLWVDEFVLMYEKDETYVWIMAHLRLKFIIPHVGTITSFLGMEIKYDPSEGTMAISQASTTGVLLDRAKLPACNPSSIPCQPGAIFSTADCPKEANTNTTTSEYRSLIAMANFISCWTRPDVTFVVNKLCKFMANPGDVHWKYLKALLRYLNGTRTRGLFYSAKKSDVPGIYG